jgi:hypothetical protein
MEMYCRVYRTVGFCLLFNVGSTDSTVIILTYVWHMFVPFIIIIIIIIIIKI